MPRVGDIICFARLLDRVRGRGGRARVWVWVWEAKKPRRNEGVTRQGIRCTRFWKNCNGEVYIAYVDQRLTDEKKQGRKGGGGVRTWHGK